MNEPQFDSDPLVILIVDDNVLERLMGCETLEKAGFRVLEAEDGKTAIHAFQQHGLDIHSDQVVSV